MAARLPTFGDVLAARRRLGTLACRTPLIEHPALNARVGGRVLLKAENLQRVGAFKFRGAYNKVSQVDAAAFPGRRGGLLVGQPRPGRGRGGDADGLQVGHRHAGRCAAHEDRAHPGVRRRGRGLRPRQRRIATPSPASCARTRACRLRASLRRSRRDRRPGHGRPRDDGAGRGGGRHARHGAGRRLGRRAHQRRVDRGQGEEPRRPSIYTVEPAGFDDLARSLAGRQARAQRRRCRARSAMRCWR